MGQRNKTGPALDKRDEKGMQPIRLGQKAWNRATVTLNGCT